MNPLLEVRNLTKHFQQGNLFARRPPVQAAAGINLTIERGETVGLVGESGSGKSTLGRVLLGLLSPTEGEVLFDGTPVHPAGAITHDLRRRMQLVFQDPYASLDPRRRIGVQIADGLRIHGLVDRDEVADRVRTLLEQVGLRPDFATRFPHEFSGGQRQRVSIARALATSPEFIVADEPVSALDVSVQAQILNLLAEMRTKLQLSMLFISHDLLVVRALCSRIIILYLGRIVEEGPTQQLFDNPRHPYTQALLSAVPRMGSKPKRRILLKGDPPSPSNPPSGCVFRTRCPIAVSDCARSEPDLKNLGAGHKAACIRLEQAHQLYNSTTQLVDGDRSLADGEDDLNDS